MQNKPQLLRLPSWRLDWGADDIRALRLCIGLTLAMALAMGIDWPLAFLAPILTLTFLNTRRPCPGFTEALKLLLMVIFTGSVGLILAVFLMDYPVVVMLVLVVVLMNIFYLNARGAPPILVTMLLLSVTVIPILGQQGNILAFIFAAAFLVAVVVALLITWLMYVLLPDSEYEIMKETANAGKNHAGEHESLVTAISSTLVVLPVVILFFSFELTNAALIMVFVVMLAQKPDLQAGFRGCMGMIIGNTIGGIIAILLYSIFSFAPTYVFLLLLVLVTSMMMAPKIFSGEKSASLIGMALSTVILLLATTIMSDDADASSKFYSRIVQIFIVTLYVVGAFSLVQLFRDWYDKRNLADHSH